MSTISFTSKAGDTWYDIRFQYDPDLVTLIKTVVPSVFRKYEPATKTWSVNAEWSKMFAVQARNAGHTTVGIGGASGGPGSRTGGPKMPPPPPPPPPAAPVAVISWADVLLSRCHSPEFREKVYKGLAKVLHADLGGDDTLMRDLNDARSRYDRNRQGRSA